MAEFFLLVEALSEPLSLITLFSWAAVFPLGAGPDEGSGWPADRSWVRAIQSVSGQRNMGGYRALWSLLRRLERHSLLKNIF